MSFPVPPVALLYALSLIPGIGSQTLRSLMRHFGSPEALWAADTAALRTVPGLGPKTAAALSAGRSASRPDEAWADLTRQEIDVLAFTDPRYPRLLNEIPDGPVLIFVRGTYAWEEKPLIAIVGARKFTSYGEQAALRFAADLAHAGYVVVSGLAFGIDSIAHRGALEAGGETLAVLAGGIDETSVAPRSHLPLARAITGHGALISEYPPGTPPAAGTFPARNRIMAGMCRGTIVIEAAEQSGTLITARLALEYNREVFAVPGSIFSPVSIGTHALIRSGAKITTSVQDILEEFPLPDPSTERVGILSPASVASHASSSSSSLNEDETQVLATLSHEPCHVDKIIKLTTLETPRVISALALLEIRGFARNIGGMHYIKL